MGCGASLPAAAYEHTAVALFDADGIYGHVMYSGCLGCRGYIRLSLEPDVVLDSFELRLTLPPGAPFSEMRALATRVERTLFKLRAELDRAQPPGDPSVITHLETSIHEEWAGFWIEVAPHARKHLVVEDFVRKWRKKIGDIGRAKIDFIYRQGDTFYDIELDLSDLDPVHLDQAATALKQHLGAYPGVFDVTDSTVPGKPEVHLKLKPEAERFGLRLKDLAEQVRGAYFGEEAQRFIRGREEVKIMVRLPLKERRSLDALRTLPVQLPEGGQVPLGSLAEVDFMPGYAQITRHDRRRVLKVQARVDPDQTDVNAIYTDLEHGQLKSLKSRFPTLRVDVGQQRQEQEETVTALVRNTLIALTVIYVLIAIPFRSYLQPFIFMLSVPVTWMGAILAHFVLKLPLSMESLVGMIAASGVVANDSLILLDYTHKRRDKGIRLPDVIAEACAARFRPIFPAFLTNFAGFLPILFETSVQAQFLVPMVLALAAGLLFGMVATLVLTPACYVILEDVRRMVRRETGDLRLETGSISFKEPVSNNPSEDTSFQPLESPPVLERYQHDR